MNSSVGNKLKEQDAVAVPPRMKRFSDLTALYGREFAYCQRLQNSFFDIFGWSQRSQL